jgi:hypothetical protein
MDNRGISVQFAVGSRDVSLLHSVQIDLGTTQPLIEWVAEALFQRLKRPGREADQYRHLQSKLRMLGTVLSLVFMT